MEDVDEKIDSSPTRKNKLTKEMSYTEKRIASSLINHHKEEDEKKFTSPKEPDHQITESKESTELPSYPSKRKISFSYDPILPAGV